MSRLSDGLPQKFFSGLLSVGDEILEINSAVVTGMELDLVYDLIADQEKLVVKLMPFAAKAEVTIWKVLKSMQNCVGFPIFNFRRLPKITYVKLNEINGNDINLLAVASCMALARNAVC